MKSRSDKMIFRTTEEEPRKKKKLGEKVKSSKPEKKAISKTVKPVKPVINNKEFVFKQEIILSKDEENVILDEDKQKSPEIIFEQEDFEDKNQIQNQNEQVNYDYNDHGVENYVQEQENEQEQEHYNNNDIEQEEEEEEEVDKKKKSRPRISKKPYQDKVVLRYTNLKDEDFYNL